MELGGRIGTAVRPELFELPERELPAMVRFPFTGDLFAGVGVNGVNEANGAGSLPVDGMRRTISTKGAAASAERRLVRTLRASRESVLSVHI